MWQALLRVLCYTDSVLFSFPTPISKHRADGAQASIPRVQRWSQKHVRLGDPEKVLIRSEHSVHSQPS